MEAFELFSNNEMHYALRPGRQILVRACQPPWSKNINWESTARGPPHDHALQAIQDVVPQFVARDTDTDDDDIGPPPTAAAAGAPAGGIVPRAEATAHDGTGSCSSLGEPSDCTDSDEEADSNVGNDGSDEDEYLGYQGVAEVRQPAAVPPAAPRPAVPVVQPQPRGGNVAYEVSGGSIV